MPLRTGSIEHFSYNKHENKLFKYFILTNVTLHPSAALIVIQDDFCSNTPQGSSIKLHSP